MEFPVERLVVDNTFSEKQDCFEEVENQHTVKNVLAYYELRTIFQYLSAKDLYKASGVCRKVSWRDAAKREAATRCAPEYFLKNYQMQNKKKKGNAYNPVLIGEDLRIKPYIGLICQKIQEKDEWIPKGSYCQNLPVNCITIVTGGYDIVADDSKIDKEFGMAVSAFLPQIPKLNRGHFGTLNYNAHPNEEDLEQLLNLLLPLEGEKSKCIILLTNHEGCGFTKSLMELLQKRYKPGTLSLWGGVCVDLKTCLFQISDNNEGSVCSKPVPWAAITLSSPLLQSWSIVLPRNCRTEAQMEDKLQRLKKKIEIKKYSLALMFACCARIRRKNLEIAVFKKVFPNIPLVGLYGDGEYGLNTLSEKRECQLQHTYSTIFLILTYQCLECTALEYDTALSNIIE